MFKKTFFITVTALTLSWSILSYAQTQATPTASSEGSVDKSKLQNTSSGTKPDRTENTGLPTKNTDDRYTGSTIKLPGSTCKTDGEVNTIEATTDIVSTTDEGETIRTSCPTTCSQYCEDGVWGKPNECESDVDSEECTVTVYEVAETK